MFMNAIRSDAGIYRNHGVRIMGTYVPTTNYLKVPELMTGLVRDINRKTNDVIADIANIHSRFENSSFCRWQWPRGETPDARYRA